MAFNMTSICRVCLSNLSNRRFSNLFFTADRPNQIWTKIMACAWVQVFEGDGLPNNICYKCHERLEISYQFKQQCEGSDAKLRQLLGRSVNSKPVLENRDCAFDHRFLPTDNRPDLVQPDLALSTYRMLNHDTSLMQNMDLRVNYDSCDTKEDLTFNVLQQSHHSLKSEVSLSENDALLNNIHAKLFEAVSEAVSDALQHPIDLIDTRDMAWDLQNKQPSLQNIAEKSMNEIHDRIGMNLNSRLPVGIAEKNIAQVVPPQKNVLTTDVEECSTVDSSPIDGHIQEFVIDKSIDSQHNNLEAALSKKSDCEISCDANGKSFVKKKSNEKKINTKRKNNEREQCELCGKTFTKSYLQKHARTHNQDRPFSCKICKQDFSMSHILISHMRLHTGEKPYACDHCGKSFTQSSSLKAHKRLHTGDKPYQCEICPKKFAQKSNLISHRQTHTNTGNVVCKICDKVFKNNKYLVSHQKLHSQVKNFKCSICEKAFARKSCLRRHMDIHMGQRPYKCAWCPMKFPSASSRRKHDFRHRHRLLFKCQICKKSFAQPSGRNRHMRRNHKMATLPPNVCQ